MSYSARIAELERIVAQLQRQVAQFTARAAQFRSEPLVLAIGKIETLGGLAGGGTCTVTLWRCPPTNGGGTGPGNEVETETEITAGDWLMGPCSGRSLVTGTRVVCARIFGTWYVIGASCCT